MKTITHNNLGKKYLVEECKNIRIDSMVRKAKCGLIAFLVQGEAELDGFTIKLRSKPLYHGGERLWFECPICQMTVGVLYKHPMSEIIGCRRCLDLEYRSRKFKGMIENKLL